MFLPAVAWEKCQNIHQVKLENDKKSTADEGATEVLSVQNNTC